MVLKFLIEKGLSIYPQRRVGRAMGLSGSYTEASYSLTFANSAWAHDLTYCYKWAQWFSYHFLKVSLPASSYFTSHKIYVKINAITSMCLSPKNFPCLPNDVVNQKIIKNHLGCNPPFLSFQSFSLHLLARNSEIYVFSCTLFALDNSGTSWMGTQPGPRVPSLAWTLMRECVGAVTSTRTKLPPLR